MSVQVPTNPILERETEIQDVYLEKLLAQKPALVELPTEISQELEKVRDRATKDVQSQRMPTRRDEEWRFTEIANLIATDFIQAQAAQPSLEQIEAFQLPETSTHRLIFVNGFYTPELSDISGLPEGVVVGNLTAVSQDILSYLGQQEGASEVFTALNTASFRDAAIIWVKPNIVVETPIQLVFVSVGNESPSVSSPRALILAQRSSSVEFVEHYIGSATYLCNAVTEVWVDENAQVKHTRVQEDSASSFHIGKTTVSQAQNSRYSICAVSFGGKLSRHTLNVWQKGEQTETYLNGLTMIEGEQIGDTHSLIALNHPHGMTDQLHKCIVGDRAHAIFNGKVFVPQPAQQTNAAQLNRNLLLSSKARVDTKPELQITADNVKCSHGATVSQLEADEVFYLRSRGLSESDSRHLLIDAFANEVLERIPIASLHNKLSNTVRAKTQD